MTSLRRCVFTIGILLGTLARPANAQQSELRTLLSGDSALNAGHLGAETSSRRILLVMDQDEREVGSIRTELTVIEINGRQVLQIRQVTRSALLGNNTSTTALDRVTLAPLWHRSEDARQTLSLEYRGDSILGVVTPAGGSPQPVAVRSDTALFDEAAEYLILRSLPLAEGFAVRFPLYLHDSGDKIWETSRVIGSEQLAGEGDAMIDTWIVESTIERHSTRNWIAKRSREMLQSTFDIGPGVQIRVVR